MPPKPHDLTGRRFSRLLVIRHIQTGLSLCRCDCGVEKTARNSNLTSGNIRSCGCLAREITSARSRTHGLKKTSEYRCWSAMKGRCYNPNLKPYKNYGGRGITVCSRWRNSFESFLADMGNSKGLTLERINNEGHYEPNNCRWATSKEQAKNRRTSVLLTALGKTQIMADWAEELKMPVWDIWHRMRRRGKSLETIIGEQGGINATPIL